MLQPTSCLRKIHQNIHTEVGVTYNIYLAHFHVFTSIIEQKLYKVERHFLRLFTDKTSFPYEFYIRIMYNVF